MTLQKNANHFLQTLVLLYSCFFSQPFKIRKNNVFTSETCQPSAIMFPTISSIARNLWGKLFVKCAFFRFAVKFIIQIVIFYLKNAYNF